MSRKAKPAVLGAFVVGAVVIVLVAVGLLTSGTLFSEYEEYVTYYPESVNGLSIGAPVKFRGIQMGEVSSIGLFADAENSYAEVILRLDYNRWRQIGGQRRQVERANIERVVRAGLRSRLEVESIVTGVVFITLELRPDAGPPRFINPESRLVEIPSAPSPMSELTESAGEVVARLSKIDVNTMSDNLIRLTETLDRKLEDVDTGTISDNLEESTDRLVEILQSGKIQELLTNLNATLDALQETNMAARSRIENLEETFVRLDTIAANLSRASESAASLMENSDQMLDKDSEFRIGLDQVLTETSLAMKSLRRLTDMLERNPNAFVTGKPEERK